MILILPLESQLTTVQLNLTTLPLFRSIYDILQWFNLTYLSMFQCDLRTPLIISSLLTSDKTQIYEFKKTQKYSGLYTNQMGS